MLAKSRFASVLLLCSSLALTGCGSNDGPSDMLLAEIISPEPALDERFDGAVMKFTDTAGREVAFRGECFRTLATELRRAEAQGEAAGYAHQYPTGPKSRIGKLWVARRDVRGSYSLYSTRTPGVFELVVPDESGGVTRLPFISSDGKLEHLLSNGCTEESKK
jgi:hypothetical protein